MVKLLNVQWKLKKVTQLNTEGKPVQVPKPVGWKFLRERTDKSAPNHVSTALSIRDSIINPISITWLLQFILHREYHVLKQRMSASIKRKSSESDDKNVKFKKPML